MQVLSVRVGLTKNLGNYESAKLEVEASPSDGQTADQLLAEVGEYMQSQVEIAVSNAGGVKEKPAKGKAKVEAPLKDTPKANPVPTEEPPFDGGNLVEDKPARGKKSTKAESQAAMGKGDDTLKVAKKELQYTIDSENLDELLERFNGVRKLAPAFGDKWEEVVTKIADRYRKLNSLDANPETLNEIVKAFKAERAAIENAKAQAVAA